MVTLLLALSVSQQGWGQSSSSARERLLDEYSAQAELSRDHRAVAIRQQLPLRQTLATLGPEQVAELEVAEAPMWVVHRVARPGVRQQLSDLRWSPDGRRLAYLRTRSRAHVLEVWDRTRHVVVYRSPCFTPVSPGVAYPYAWVDATHVAVLTGAEPCAAIDSLWPASADIQYAVHNWRQAADGPVRSVLDSEEGDSTLTPPLDVRVFDIAHGTMRVFARGPFAWLHNREWEPVSFSPNGRWLVLLERVRYLPPFASERHALLELAEESRWVNALQVVDLTGQQRTARIPPPAEGAILPISIRWAADGAHFAFPLHDWNGSSVQSCALAYTMPISTASSAPAAQMCGELGNRPWHLPRHGEGDVLEARIPASDALRWSADGRLLVQRQTPSVPGRYDWYLAVGGDQWTNLSRGLTQIPREFVVAGPYTLCVADGRLWALTAGSAERRAGASDALVAVAAPELADSVTAVDTVSGERQGGAALARVTVTPRGRSSSAEHTVVLRLSGSGSDSLDGVPHPMPIADPKDEMRLDLHRAGDTERVVIVGGSRPGEHIVGTTVVKPAPERDRRTFVYRTRAGDTLTALLTLPTGYIAGRHYPTIVEVYPTYDRAEQGGAPFTEDLPDKGFAVLTPTALWSDTSGEAGTRMQDLAGAVLPAIDAAVRIGYTDSARVGVIGHSAGGYAVYALLTQTTRFRAAVALSGPMDFVGSYGLFGSGTYLPNPPSTWYMSSTETGQFVVRSAPWANPEAYVKGTPLFYADRITTPLLIAQGDDDYVPVENGEQMYSALWRQGKHVQFIRYWGEAHGLQGYYPQRDLYDRITRWFTRYLGAAPDSGGRRPADSRAK